MVSETTTTLVTAPFAAGLGETRIQFPEGLPGFENHSSWEIVAHPDAVPFFWLRSVLQPAISLLVVDPRVVVEGYEAPNTRAALGRIGLKPGDPVVVLTIATLRGFGQATVNLRAPLFIDPAGMRGAQVILEDASLPIRHPLAPGRT